MPKKKQSKKITPSAYDGYLTGSASMFGSYDPKGETKDGYADNVKKSKKSQKKVNY